LKRAPASGKLGVSDELHVDMVVRTAHRPVDRSN
jgi:hypothetical protein